MYAKYFSFEFANDANTFIDILSCFALCFVCDYILWFDCWLVGGGNKKGDSKTKTFPYTNCWDVLMNLFAKSFSAYNPLITLSIRSLWIHGHLFLLLRLVFSCSMWIMSVLACSFSTSLYNLFAFVFFAENEWFWKLFNKHTHIYI